MKANKLSSLLLSDINRMMTNFIVLLIILLLSLPLVTLQLRLIYHQRYNHQLNALNNDNNDNLLPALDDICQRCIENSKMKFRQGLSKAFTTTTSNTGNQIMDEEDKLPIINILNNTILSPDSNLAKNIMNSSEPLIINVSPLFPRFSGVGARVIFIYYNTLSCTSIPIATY